MLMPCSPSSKGNRVVGIDDDFSRTDEVLCEGQILDRNLLENNLWQKDNKNILVLDFIGSVPNSQGACRVNPVNRMCRVLWFRMLRRDRCVCVFFSFSVRQLARVGMIVCMRSEANSCDSSRVPSTKHVVICRVWQARFFCCSFLTRFRMHGWMNEF